MGIQKIKIVINKGYKPFQLSRKAMDFLGLVHHCDALMKYNGRGRMNSRLIDCVESMGIDASANGALLVVEEVDVGEPFMIKENRQSGGSEYIHYKYYSIWFVAGPTQTKS